MEEMESINALENINITEVCRACFETCEQYKILFDEAETTDKRTLGDVFFDVVKIDITTDAETKPGRLCLTCCNDLTSAYNFIQKSQKNNERLVQYLNNASSLKKHDCLHEFPIEDPNDQSVSDFLQIKVEDETISEYKDTMTVEFKNSPANSNDSDGSDYHPTSNKKMKIENLQCAYCKQVVESQDCEDHMRTMHPEECVQKKETEEEESECNVLECEDCDFCSNSKLEMEQHQKAEHKTSMRHELLGYELLDPDPLSTSNASFEFSVNDFLVNDEDEDPTPTYHLANENKNSNLRILYEAAHETSTHQPKEHNLPSEYSSSSSSTKPTITRKRKRNRNPSLWKRNVRKNLREQGLPFESTSGVLRPGRTIGEACLQTCFYGCTLSITNSERKQIHTYFWSLTSEEKKIFYVDFIKRDEVKRRRKPIKHDEHPKKKATFHFYFKIRDRTIQVCKKYFLSTLSISQRTVYYFFKTNYDLNEQSKPQNFKRGRKLAEKT